MSSKTITRAEISDALRRKLYMSRSESLESIDTVLSEVINILKEDKKIKIPLFGVFFPRHKKARVGRNPKTLESALITARRVAGFRLSRLMKDRVDHSLKKKKTTVAA